MTFALALTTALLALFIGGCFGLEAVLPDDIAAGVAFLAGLPLGATIFLIWLEALGDDLS